MKTTTKKARKPDAPPVDLLRTTGYRPKHFSELTRLIYEPWTVRGPSFGDHAYWLKFHKNLRALQRGSAER